MGTAKRIDQLRGDLEGLLRDGLRDLRAEMLGAFTRGLDTHEELQRVLGREQRELALAHKDARDLRRQLDEARAARGGSVAAGDAGSALLGIGPVWPPAIGRECAGPGESPLPNGAAADGVTPPEEPPVESTPDRGSAPSAPSVKEIPVPENTSDNDERSGEGPAGPDPQERQSAARVAAEFAAAARELDFGRGPSSDSATPSASSQESTAGPDQAGQSGKDALFNTLYKAASISAADIVCHPHTWQFIVGGVASAGHFQLPVVAADADRDGLVTIPVSGRSLVAILNSLHGAYMSASHSSDLQSRALALGYYVQIAHEVDRTHPVFSRHEDAEPDPVNRPRTRVVLDRRPDYVVDGSPRGNSDA